jgi:hypothetical protein
MRAHAARNWNATAWALRGTLDTRAALSLERPTSPGVPHSPPGACLCAGDSQAAALLQGLGAVAGRALLLVRVATLGFFTLFLSAIASCSQTNPRAQRGHPLIAGSPACPAQVLTVVHAEHALHTVRACRSVAECIAALKADGWTIWATDLSQVMPPLCSTATCITACLVLLSKRCVHASGSHYKESITQTAPCVLRASLALTIHEDRWPSTTTPCQPCSNTASQL